MKKMQACTYFETEDACTYDDAVHFFHTYSDNCLYVKRWIGRPYIERDGDMWMCSQWFVPRVRLLFDMSVCRVKQWVRAVMEWFRG